VSRIAKHYVKAAQTGVTAEAWDDWDDGISWDQHIEEVESDDWGLTEDDLDDWAEDPRDG